MKRYNSISCSWIAILLWATVLPGCKQDQAESFASSAQPYVLMSVAVPGWEEKGAASVRKITPPPEPKASQAQASATEPALFALSPLMVVTLAKDRVVLLVKGRPANDKGEDIAGHSTSAILGAYWFERREDKWYKVAEQPEFGEEGFYGDPGTLHVVSLGGGQQALAVETESCWQGQCGKWLNLYGLGLQKVTPLITGGGVQIGSDTTSATGECAGLMEAPVGSQQRVGLDSYSTAYGCYAIRAQWSIRPSNKGPGDLWLDFAGKQTSEKQVPIIPAANQNPARASAPAAAEDSDDSEDDVPTDEYLVTIHGVKERLIYRFQNGHYVWVSGKNPAPGI